MGEKKKAEPHARDKPALASERKRKTELQVEASSTTCSDSSEPDVQVSSLSWFNIFSIHIVNMLQLYLPIRRAVVGRSTIQTKPIPVTSQHSYTAKSLVGAPSYLD